MENQRQTGFPGFVNLPAEPFFLYRPGRIHAVEIKSGLTPGTDLLAEGSQAAQSLQGCFIALDGVMGMDADRGKYTLEATI